MSPKPSPKPSQLLESQMQFSRMVHLLLGKLYEMGYETTFGETYRSQQEADRLYSLGKGAKNSLHTLRLAIDLNLFKDGQYLTNTSDYEPLGVWWESIGGSWGGRFSSRQDGNHFSLSYNGLK